MSMERMKQLNQAITVKWNGPKACTIKLFTAVICDDFNKLECLPLLVTSTWLELTRVESLTGLNSNGQLPDLPPNFRLGQK